MLRPFRMQIFREKSMIIKYADTPHRTVGKIGKQTMTLKEVITRFMEGCADGVATLKEIYNAIDNSGYESKSDTVHESARAIIYRNEDTFKRVCKGV
jgi:uncharacterized protein Yka (UPF0111/DUF47 family)